MKLAKTAPSSKWNREVLKRLELAPNETLSRFREGLDIPALAQEYATTQSPAALKLLNVPNSIEFVAKNFLYGMDLDITDERVCEQIRVLIVKIPQLRALIITPRRLVETIYADERIPNQIMEAMKVDGIPEVLSARDQNNLACILNENI
jgi:hypothetical protein